MLLPRPTVLPLPAHGIETARVPRADGPRRAELWPPQAPAAIASTVRNDARTFFVSL